MSTNSLRHPLTRALLVLTFTTGVIDAASYLGELAFPRFKA